MDRFLLREEPSITSSASSQASNELENQFDDLVGIPVAPEISSAPSQTPTTPAAGFPDYSFWDATAFERFPGHIIYHNPSQERVWWWRRGFRLKDCSNPAKEAVIWVCEQCVRAGARNRNLYRFVANTGKSITAHLWKTHHITVSTASQSLVAC